MKTSVFNTFRVCSMLTLGLTTVLLSADEDSEGSKKKEVSEHPSRERVVRPRAQGSTGKKGVYLKSFQAVDIDKDGELTFGEFSMMERLTKMGEKKRRRLFGFLDRNKDGKLHTRELQAREPIWIVSVRKNFTLIDSDKSGGLSLVEFSQASAFSDKPKEMADRAFIKMDSNRNQVIERSELKWSRRSKARSRIDFEKYDINQSNSLDFEEYAKLPLMDKCSEERRKHLFARIDTDNNREISKKEIKAAHKKHRAFSPHGKPHRDRGSMRDGKEGERKPRRHGHEEPKKGGASPTASPKSTNA